MARKETQHTVPYGDKWAVRKGGASRITKSFDTQAEADSYGRQVARNHDAEYYLHGKDGKIREKDSYGNDPFPPRG